MYLFYKEFNNAKAISIISKKYLNAHGYFQAFVNAIFGDLIDSGLVAYIDDLLYILLTCDKILFGLFNGIDTLIITQAEKRLNSFA